MSETRYMISDTAKKVDVEAHVLRYWEEELEIGISRTELGHRYYTEEDIRLFRKIKELKERGLQLRAIKLLIPELKKQDMEEDARETVPEATETAEEADTLKAEEECRMTGELQRSEDVSAETLPAVGPDPDKLKQFESIVTGIFKQVIQENNAELEGRITDSLVKEVNLLLQVREERQEERFRRLDETIRAYQKNRQLVAAAKESDWGRKRRFRFFGGSM